MFAFKSFYRKPLTLIAIIYMSFFDPALAQSNSPPVQNTNTVTMASWPNAEAWLGGAILVFGLIVLVLQFMLIRSSRNAGPEDCLRLFTVTMIIAGTLALIAIGYTANQIGPALGLFGTIIGYLLGKTDEYNKEKRYKDDDRQS